MIVGMTGTETIQWVCWGVTA